MAIDDYGVSGHGYSVEVEHDPDGSPDDYVPVGGLDVEVVDEMTREYTASMPHNVGVDGGIVSNIISRPDQTFENNYKPGDPVHDGIIREHFRLNRLFKVRRRAAGGTSGSDEIIESGKVISYRRSNPNGAGKRVLTWVFRPIGEFIVDGVTYE